MEIVIEHPFLFFIRFRTVPMATDGDVSEPPHSQATWFRNRAKTQKAPREKRGAFPFLQVDAWSDAAPWQTSMGRTSLKRLERNRREPTQTEEPASRREAMMAGGLQVPSKTGELKRNSPGKTKLKNDRCLWWRVRKRHSRKLTKTSWFRRNHPSRAAAGGLRPETALSGFAKP